MYKDKEKQRNYNRERMQKVRQGNTGGVTRRENVLPEVEMVPAFGSLPERPRFLSDGQVLDRAKQPKADLTLWSGWRIEALRRCNEADKMKPLKAGYDVNTLRKALRLKSRGV